MSTIGPFTNVPEPGAPIASAWAQQLTQYAVDLAASLAPPWSGTPTILTGWSGSGVRFRKVGDLVHVRGRLTNSSGGALTSASPAFNLPADHRPPATQAFTLPTDATTPTVYLWAVENGGNVRPAAGLSIPNGTTVVFDMPFMFSTLAVT